MFNKLPGASEEGGPDRPQFENCCPIRLKGEDLEKGEIKCPVLDTNA